MQLLITDPVPAVDLESSAAEILRYLDTWSEAQEGWPDQREKLWTVLSALRGPDIANRELKHNTTAAIRRVVQHLARESGATVSLEPFVRPTTNDHFSRHIRRAAEAILEMFGSKALD